MKLLRYNIILLNILIFFAPAVFLAGTANVNTSGSSSILQDFKAILMYFSEAFMKGATFGNQTLEGEMPLVMPRKLINVLDCLENEYSDAQDDMQPILNGIRAFNGQLKVGIEVAAMIEELAKSSFTLTTTAERIEKSKKIQEFVITYFNQKDYNYRLVIPTGWIGHATALVITISGYGTDHYDIAYINTGQGLQHHYRGSDPNNVYPHLSSLWIEFKNIPKDLIFDPETAWFFYGLTSVNGYVASQKIINAIGDGGESLPNYLYDSLLANFREYLVEPQGEEATRMLYPQQQSGSCAMSSLMGALLYCSDFMVDFHWYRLKIGHIFLENFMKRLESVLDNVDGSNNDSDIEFVRVLTDGFLSGGSRLFRGLSRALANVQLQYLEHKFPDEFKHAGLIGVGRSTWISEKKAEAIRALESDETALLELSKTLKLAESVHKTCKNLNYRHDTTQIQNMSETRNSFYFAYEEKVRHDTEAAAELRLNANPSLCAYQSIVEGVPERLEIDLDPETFPFEFFDHFYYEFTELFQRTDSHKEAYYLRFLDIFRRLRAGPGWSMIHDHWVKSELLDLQEMCKKITFKFAELENNFPNRKVSMDEVTLLGHFQLLSWHIFRALHNLYDRGNRIVWDDIVPPTTVQNVILPSRERGKNISGEVSKWLIRGFDDIENYRLYQLFIEEGRSEVRLDNNPKYNFFPGPDYVEEELGKFYQSEAKVNDLFKDANLKAIFENFMNIPEVGMFLATLKSRSYDWSKVKDDFGKFWIVLSTGQEVLYEKIPHFYNLMYTLNCIKLGVSSRGIQFNGDTSSDKFWLKPAADPNFRRLEKLVTFKRHNSVFSLERGEYPLDLLNTKASSNWLFYSLRHCNVFGEDPRITDVQVWLNYIKDARTSRIFDDPYFQYMTDHILNIPKYMIKSHNGVQLFSEASANKVIQELIKLIESTLKQLCDDPEKMSSSRREQIVRRVANMSVITTRFISRADFEFGNSADPIDWAAYLAKLYNMVEPYSHLNSAIMKLTDSEFSMMNFVLSHMCFTRLRMPENFMNAVKLGFEYSYKRHRRTLARVHWFIAKMNYVLSNNEMIADDQFKYGFLGNSLELAEIRFVEAVLKEKFLRNYLKTESDYSFRYESNRYVVEIICHSQTPTRLLINLATGAIIENGQMLTSNSSFVNSPEFQKYFSIEERKYLRTVGKAYVIYGIPVYTMPTFKGSDYFMIQLGDNFWLFRKWNNNWYVWRPQEVCRSVFDALGYNWQGNPIRIFRKSNYNIDLQEADFIIFDEGKKDPILKITKFSDWLGEERGEYLCIYESSVPELTDGISAQILSDPKCHDMHLRKFAEEGLTFTRQISDGTFVVIYNNHRLPDDPMRSFVLTAKDETEFKVQNVANMTICKDQRIGKDGLGLPGCLIASFDGKKILLAPFAEVLKKSSLKNSGSHTYIMIEKIPMSKASISETDIVAIPAPQSRMHKLLLAYYMILAQNYDSARKILHPSTSINHNSMFSKNEMQIVLWIMRIDMESPEFYAMALVTFSHFLINNAKFSFDYTEEVSKLAGKLLTEPPTVIFEKYMMSIRELPEKYYIFKIFPEILVENSVLSNAFFTDGGNRRQQIEKTSENFEFPKSFPSYWERYTFGERQSLTGFYDLMLEGSESSPATKLIKYTLIRSRSTVTFDKGFEMAMYCYAKRPELWDSFITALGPECSNLISNNTTIKNIFNSNILICAYREKFKDDFKGISLAKISSSTSLKNIEATMRSDLGIFDEYRGEASNHLIAIDTKEERGKLLTFRTNLMNRIKGAESYNADVDFGLDTELVESSTVLRSLSNSIRTFVSEGMNHMKSLDLTADENLLIELGDLNETLTKRITDLEREQESLIDTLISETYPHEKNLSLSNAINNLFSMMHQRKRKAFSDLHACYMKDSLSCIQKKFPQLNLDECRKVYTDSILFFSQSILLNYLKMIHKSVKNFMNSDSDAADDLMAFCNELEKIADFNERIQNPLIMNFEFRSTKYRLKSEQVKDIELLTSEESDNFKSVVIQRMMAAGKTLVLGTISVVMKALKRNDRLSILVPPSSLYQSNTTSMQNRTYQYFKKKGNNFNFTRLPLPNNRQIAKRLSDFLDNVIGTINHTMTSRSYLILSPDHLQSFLNSYIEVIEGAKVLCSGDNYHTYKAILQRFALIYQIFKEKSSIILDEIDMTMDPKKELNFPTTETETYNMTAVTMLADIIEFMLFSNEIKDAGLNIYSNNQAALTPENYVICRRIALEYIKSQLKDENSLWRKYVPENETENVMEFLRSENILDKKDWIIETSNENLALANALVIVKTQLYLHFEDFLGATVNQNYGSAGNLRSDIKYAVPYVAANTPSSGSVFADRWETLVKTILMISASPCSIEIAKEVTRYIKKSIALEYSNSDSSSMPTLDNLRLIIPDCIDILTLDENDYLHVTIVHGALISRSPAAIRILYGYYINEIFSKMEFPVEQITSNALHMTSMFASVQGYSGTIDNVNILPTRVVAEAFRDHEDNEKNNGGIALKLIKDFDNEIIPELKDESFTLNETEMIREFFGNFESTLAMDKVSAIIDTGAFFKNFKNKKVAEAILKYFNGRIKAVLFYDEDSNELQFLYGVYDSGKLVSTSTGLLETTDPDDINTTTQTGINERFTFYDQRHITGSDILQPKSALAIMTAGPRVLLRDLLQGTLRMRQFMTTQKVHLMITESLRKFYNSKIGSNNGSLRVSDLITLGSLNEDKKQIRENEKLAFGKIDSEIRSFILDEISKHLTESVHMDLEKITSLYHANRDLFIRSIREEPISWLYERKPENTVNVLEKHAASRLAALSPFLNTPEERSRYDELAEKLGLMYKVEYGNRNDSLLKYLKSEINVRTDDRSGNEMVIQNQTQTLTLMDMDVDQYIDKKDVKLSPTHSSFTLLTHNQDMMQYGPNGSVQSRADNFYSLSAIFERQPQSTKQFVNSVLFTDGKQIGVTTDLVNLYISSNNKFPIFSKYTLEGSHLLVFANPLYLNEPRVLLLSSRHASSAFNDIQNNSSLNKYMLWLCDLSGEVTISRDPRTQKTMPPVGNVFDIEQFKPKLDRMIFDLLIFNGSFPQILANPRLRALYENEWIKAANFKDRALFLRLRMRALAEKDSIIFDDDDQEYKKLRMYSSGDPQTMQKKEKTCAEGYLKCAVSKDIQDAFMRANPSIFDVESLCPAEDPLNLTSYTLPKKMEEIFGNIDAIELNDESFLHLSEIDFANEHEELVIKDSVDSNASMDKLKIESKVNDHSIPSESPSVVSSAIQMIGALKNYNQ